MWTEIRLLVESLYDMEILEGKGYRQWKRELKFRRGGKTLCGLYAGENASGFMIIFGAAEREKFESVRGEFSSATAEIYDAAQVYHDGKWVMFPLTEETAADAEKLLKIKRIPNRR